MKWNLHETPVQYFHFSISLKMSWWHHLQSSFRFVKCHIFLLERFVGNKTSASWDLDLNPSSEAAPPNKSGDESNEHETALSVQFPYIHINLHTLLFATTLLTPPVTHLWNNHKNKNPTQHQRKHTHWGGKWHRHEWHTAAPEKWWWK